MSGLLTGCDIYEQLADKELGDELLLPDNALRAEDRDFLCGMTLEELSDKLSIKIRTVGSDGYAFAEAVFGIEE